MFMMFMAESASSPRKFHKTTALVLTSDSTLWHVDVLTTVLPGEFVATAAVY